MINTDLIQKSKAYAESKLSALKDDYVYHNLNHTKKVAAAAEEIGEKSGLSKDQLETVIISAWLHDTGYVNGSQDHENQSIENAKQQLSSWNAPSEKIDAVCNAIKATEMPQNPQDIVEKVLCDADLAHLANGNLKELGQRLREEMATTKKMVFTDNEWLAYNLNFIESHTYFTEYGKTVLEKSKQKNLKNFKKESKPIHYVLFEICQCLIRGESSILSPVRTHFGEER